MTCEKYQSLSLNQRSSEDQLTIKLAKVSHIPVLLRDEAEPGYSSPGGGADVPGATQSPSEPLGTTI